MNISPINVYFDTETFWVRLEDGRTIGIPLRWYPRLYLATPEQRKAYHLSYDGIHWDEIDEDISVEGLMEGKKDNTKFGKDWFKTWEEEFKLNRKTG